MIQLHSFVRFLFMLVYRTLNMLFFSQRGDYMRKLFTLKTNGLFIVEIEGSVYSIYNYKTHTLSFYNYAGEPLHNYKRPCLKETETSNKNDENVDGLRYNKYGVACSDACLVDSDGNEIPDTKLNCEDSCDVTDRYFTFALLTEDQCISIDRCGTADDVTLDYYDTKTRQYVLRGIPECKLYVFCFDGEPEVILAAAQLIDQYDSIDVRKRGTIVAHKDGCVTVYDYYQ